MFHLIFQSVKISLKALLSNKGRSFLTMAGIIIGVGAVILIMSVGAGAQYLILAQVKSLGSNMVGIMPGKSDDGMPASAMGIVITTLKYEDAVAINNKKNVPNAVDVVSFAKGVGTASWKENTYDTNLSGTTVGYLAVEGGEVADGRFFNQDEEKNLTKVAVLGYTAKKELFGDSDAVGQKIKIKKHSFEVIGVMKERGKVAFQDYDDQILLPLVTMQKLISGVDHLGLIRVKIDREENIDRAIEDITDTLRETHGINDKSGTNDDFTIRSAAEAVEMITVITDALRYFLAAMAALSLVVGGIGIMNIMLVSVTERTREIGLRKAIGAKRSNILAQFLFEAVTVTLLGGIIGIIGGTFISYIAYQVITALDYDWEFSIAPFSIVLAIGISTLIGLVFGIYPANKAGKLEPVEALRYE